MEQEIKMNRMQYQPCEETELTVVNEKEAVLVHLGNALTFHLNLTGLFIWNDLKSGYTMEEIALRLNRNFDVDLEVARREVSKFIGNLISLELIKSV